MQELGYIPASIVGGESIWIAAANTAQDSEDIIIDDYTPAGGYTLAYTFGAATPITVAAVANADDTGWTLDVTGVQTLTLTPGRVPFVGMVTHTATARTFAVDAGGIYVNPSPMRVSDWQAIVTAIDAGFLTLASDPTASVSVDGMSMTRQNSDQFIKLRNYAVEQLRRDTGRKAPRRILTRFV